MTQMTEALKGRVTPQMQEVASTEGIDIKAVSEGIAEGTIVIPKNINHRFRAIGIGKGLSTKINANIGTSPHHCNADEEREKMKASIHYGAHSVMDLSTGGNLSIIRNGLLKDCGVIFGTVPIYQVASEFEAKGKTIFEMTADDLFKVIEEHAKDGVDFITVHCGVTRKILPLYKKSERHCGIVSRGGTILAAWMEFSGKENPLYEQFDRLLAIAKEYDVTLSLGDGLRPGAIGDATDQLQIEELMTLGELTLIARKEEVQVMIEGPGHVPIHQITANVLLEKRICHGAPFYVLGPLTCDIAAGYDHITGAIGGAIASAAGADFLCYLTPAEHLRLPTLADVRDGVIATLIAAHSGDIAKGVKGAMERDNEMSKYRKSLDWEGQFRLALDPEKAREYRQNSEDYDVSVCTMCGPFCAYNLANITLDKKGKEKVLEHTNSR